MKLSSLCWLVLSLSSASEAELRIILRVANDAKVPDSILAKAEKDAEYIAGKAGLRITWLHCPPRSVLDGPSNPCHREFTPAEFWLRITPEKLPALSEETLGLAIHDPVDGLGGGYAYVSYPMVLALTNVHASESQVLGAAFAHEIGHLLLGPTHSSSGVMCARWRREHFELMSIGRLFFTSEESRRLQIEVARRMTTSGELTQH